MRHLRLRKARSTDPVDLGSEYTLPTRIERAAVLALEEALYGARRADVLAVAARRSWTHSSEGTRNAVLAARTLPAASTEALVVRIGHLADAHHLTAAGTVQRMVVVTSAVLTLRTEDTD